MWSDKRGREKKCYTLLKFLRRAKHQFCVVYEDTTKNNIKKQFDFTAVKVELKVDIEF